MRELLVFCDRESLETDYLAEFVETKRVPQNLFYLLNGATSFYSYRNHDLAQIAWQDEYRFFARQPFWSRDQRAAFISLGCGNAGPEKMLLRHMANHDYRVDYVGVDSSEAMLELAAENLASEPFRQSYVLGDFTHSDFHDGLHELVADYDRRIYAMIGGTFGNFEQVWIADLLADLVLAGDFFYLDVVPMYADEVQNMQLRDRFSRLPDNLYTFFDKLLDRLGLERADGDIVAEQTSDDDLNTLRSTFYFKPHEDLVFACLGQDVSLRRGERVELMSIRAYDVDSLTTFLGDRGFARMDTYVPDVGNLSHLWQRMLFQKQA
jgi:hypothetical protein